MVQQSARPASEFELFTMKVKCHAILALRLTEGLDNRNHGWGATHKRRDARFICVAGLVSDTRKNGLEVRAAEAHMLLRIR